MSYPIALALASAAVALLERLRPARPTQRPLRPGLAGDVAFLMFNGHFLGLGLAAVTARTLDAWSAPLHLGLAAGWPLWVQAAVALVVLDFAQWAIHVTLHRVPWLWTFHKVHHTVRDGEMDWIVSFRFHWMEAVVYRTLQYLPLALLGFAGEALFFHAVVGTVIGHLNHANLDWGHGPWRYVLNSPRMHLWHHDADASRAVNFGIVFSAWDWLFGTASLPDHPPRRLGFDGQDHVPYGFVGRSLWPLSRRHPAPLPGGTP